MQRDLNMSRKIAIWLFFCAASVFIMALVGAITRLTESGLSITEWKPVTGALPPLGDAAWQHEFDLYKQSPQYLKVTHGMSLAEFKYIFFWEWAHRLWGRLIGLFYALPLLYFWKYIDRFYRPRFLLVLVLGFMQGAMGWYMVKSGLVDQPSVSHYRLAAHLMLAFAIYAAMLRLGLSHAFAREDGAEKLMPLKPYVRGVILLAVLTMAWGAFVAGLDAGLLYNTFPSMDGHWFPPEALQHQPVWMAFFEEPASVQFTHRVLALLTFTAVWALFFVVRRLPCPPRARRLLTLAAAAVTLQAILGISTLLSHVNIVLAVTHQAGALVLLGVLSALLQHISVKT